MQNSDRNLWKVFIQGSFAPKTPNFEEANRYLTQSRLQVKGYTAERCCLLHVVVQGPGSFRCRSTFLYDVRLRSYGASKLPNFWILAYFPHTRLVKRTFRWKAYSPAVTSQNDSDFSYGSRRSKGVPSGTGVFLRLLVGKLWIPKLAQIFAYGKCNTLIDCYYTARQIWTVDVWKRAMLRTDVLSVGWRMFPCIYRDSQDIWTHEFVHYSPLCVHVQVHYYWKSRD